MKKTSGPIHFWTFVAAILKLLRKKISVTTFEAKEVFQER